MTQGLPERPPLGHAMHALRHFVRDAVVFDDYTIAEGMVVPQGALRRRYHPETCPTLPQQLARLARGDTIAVLAFVRTYGLLGYAALAAAVGRGAPSDTAGDPLGWIWAHAETVALCLHLTYGLQAGDDAALASLTGRATPAAAADRERPPADAARRVGSAAGALPLGVTAAQP